jgi:hypothetical protein
MEKYSVNWHDVQTCYGHRQEPVALFDVVFLGGGTKIGGFCHTDVLVGGPTFLSEKASGENILF